MKKTLHLAIWLMFAAVFAFSLFMFHRAVGLTSPWFSLDVMFSFLGLVAFGRPLFLLRVPRWLREVRGWELAGRFYRALGVPAFGVVLRRTPLRLLNPEVYLGRNPGDPSAVLAKMESAEAAHLWAALLLVPFLVSACVKNWWNVVFWFMLVEVAGNIYPILNLRRVRGRLKRCLSRRSRLRPPGET